MNLNYRSCRTSIPRKRRGKQTKGTVSPAEIWRRRKSTEVVITAKKVSYAKKLTMYMFCCFEQLCPLVEIIFWCLVHSCYLLFVQPHYRPSYVSILSSNLQKVKIVQTRQAVPSGVSFQIPKNSYTVKGVLFLFEEYCSKHMLKWYL